MLAPTGPTSVLGECHRVEAASRPSGSARPCASGDRDGSVGDAVAHLYLRLARWTLPASRRRRPPHVPTPTSRTSGRRSSPAYDVHGGPRPEVAPVRRSAALNSAPRRPTAHEPDPWTWTRGQLPAPARLGQGVGWAFGVRHPPDELLGC